MAPMALNLLYMKNYQIFSVKKLNFSRKFQLFDRNPKSSLILPIFLPYYLPQAIFIVRPIFCWSIYINNSFFKDFFLPYFCQTTYPPALLIYLLFFFVMFVTLVYVISVILI